MAGVRRRVSLVALVWLLSHVATIGVSFAGLCCAPAPAAVSDGDEDACCAGLAPGQMCPLHKHGSHESNRRVPPPPGPDSCAMRSGCDSSAITLTAVTLGLGLLPEVTVVSAEAGVLIVSLTTTSPLARSILPDLPPPRA